MTSDLPPLAFGFVLVAVRCSSLFLVAPLYGLHTVPARVRMAAALAVSLAVFMGAGAPGFTAWQRADALLLAAARETLMGLGVGLSARFMLDAAAAAGHVMGMSMGLGMGSVIDPVHGTESTAISQLLSLLALAFAVALGIHREAVAWLCRSLAETPPGASFSVGELAARVAGQAAHATALAVRLAFPVLAATLLGHLGMALLGRVTPQLGLSNVGFSIALLAGCAALYLVAPPAAAAAAEAARAAFAPP